jgi:predicted glycogen debranching enzyme
MVAISAQRLSCEWLEADGLGGFASGTVGGARTRRYHALLLCATAPPTGRIALVNGLEVWVETPRGRYALSSQRYHPDVIFPDGYARIEEFDHNPWPTWTFRAEDGTEIRQEIVVRRGQSEVLIAWRLEAGNGPIRLHVRPLLSGRDYHGLHRENGAFRFDPTVDGETVTWRPYEGLPSVLAMANGPYRHEPDWYRNFLYVEERNRGLDCIEDLASPGCFTWELSSPTDAVLILRAGEVQAAECDWVRLSGPEAK